MKLTFLTSIKDTVEGLPTPFAEGDICEVPDADAQRFITNGWATSPDGSRMEPIEGPVDLKIANGVIGHKATTLGAK